MGDSLAPFVARGPGWHLGPGWHRGLVRVAQRKRGLVFSACFFFVPPPPAAVDSLWFNKAMYGVMF